MPLYRGFMAIYKSHKKEAMWDFEVALWHAKSKNKEMLRGLFNIKGQEHISYDGSHSKAYQPGKQKLPTGLFRPPADLPF